MTTDVTTASELLDWYVPGKRAELIRGCLIVSEPPGAKHGSVANRLAFLITKHVEAHDLGRVYAAETGFWIEMNPDTVRAPDVAFVSNARLPEDDPDGYAQFVPDLVAEVLSPSDRASKVAEKVRDWRAAGVRLVWVVGPRKQFVRVYREDGSETTISGNHTLGAEPVLPGFRCGLDEVFGQ